MRHRIGNPPQEQKGDHTHPSTPHTSRSQQALKRCRHFARPMGRQQVEPRRRRQEHPWNPRQTEHTVSRKQPELTTRMLGGRTGDRRSLQSGTTEATAPAETQAARLSPREPKAPHGKPRRGYSNGLGHHHTTTHESGPHGTLSQGASENERHSRAKKGTQRSPQMAAGNTGTRLERNPGIYEKVTNGAAYSTS